MKQVSSPEDLLICSFALGVSMKLMGREFETGQKTETESKKKKRTHTGR
jgi:hypothetical protein